ncbi:MAG: diaminopimelate decarboxylase [Pirellulaceae bacterium]|jgi:diaminopimelate decarboxylase|nr:diaminopimelate decarboxylase [Pirellulaceae bacterium]MDP7019521.1 diaminopimelate decarboxylase [Pirellulaceae bacterium]
MTTSNSFSTIRHEIAGIPVAQLANDFGTPAYIYEAALIRDRIRELNEFDVVRYAQKACSNIAILDLVRRAGGLVDTVSANEIRRALAAGFRPASDPPEIVYTADIFDEEALQLVNEQSIHVNVGSPDMIDQLGERAPGSHITVRVNPGFGHGHSRKTNTGGESSKHGVWHEQLDDCLRRADRHGIAVSGLHMHIGSGTDFEHLASVCGAMERCAMIVGRSLTTISAGGGLPVPYRDSDPTIDLGEYFRLWDATRSKLAEEFGHPISLEIEPGRYLLAECGYLISEIRAVKEMGDNLFYLVDAGFNNLARPIMYGAYHPISISPQHGSERKEHDVVVGGPLCESGDIFTQEEGGVVCARRLPKATVGEYLVIENAGAYGYVMGSNYNSKPFAPEVIIDGGKAHLIRARQSFEEIIRGESIPDWE